MNHIRVTINQKYSSVIDSDEIPVETYFYGKIDYYKGGFLKHKDGIVFLGGPNNTWKKCKVYDFHECDAEIILTPVR